MTVGAAALGAATSCSSGGEGRGQTSGPVLVVFSNNHRSYRSVLLQVIGRRVGPLDEGWRSVGRRTELDRAPAGESSTTQPVINYKMTGYFRTWNKGKYQRTMVTVFIVFIFSKQALDGG